MRVISFPMPELSDNATTLAELKERVLAFARERDWEQFHSPKNLSMALAAESAELMEHFLWASPEQSRAVAADPAKRARIAEELADVVIYALEFANATGLDVAANIEAKMACQRPKVPGREVAGPVGQVHRALSRRAGRRSSPGRRTSHSRPGREARRIQRRRPGRGPPP